MDTTPQPSVFGETIFPKTLYSNFELLKTNSYPIWKILVLLIVNISLITAPFFMARYGTKPEDVFAYMPGLEESLKLLYQEEVPCQIEDGTFTCVSITGTNRTFGDYQVYFLPGDSAQIPTDHSRIVFRESDIILDYVALDAIDNYTITGNYRFLDLMDFAIVNRTDLHMEDLTEADFYRTINETFLQSILNSTLSDYLWMIYLAQAVQTILYALMMSILLMASNFRRSVKRLRYSSSLKYVVAGITGPALLAAAVGLISTTIGTILWSAVYAVRMILLYSKINKLKETL